MAAYYIRFYTGFVNIFPPSSPLIPEVYPYLKLSCVIALSGMLIYERFGFYDSRIGLDRRVRSGSLIIATAVIYVFLMAFLFNYSGGFSRLTVALAVPVSCFSVVFVQHFLKRVQFVLIKRGVIFLKTVLVGSEIRCLEYTQKIQEHHGSEYQIVGFISPEEYDSSGRQRTGIPCLGAIKDLREVLAKYKIHNLIIALSAKESLSCAGCCRCLQGTECEFSGGPGCL